MKKDRFGVCLTFYAVLGFVLAILGQTLLGGLLLAFAILAEQDEWLIRQTMQAFFLSLISGVINAAVSVLSPLYGIPVLGTALSVVFGAVTSVVSLAVLVFALIGLFNAAKGKDAAVPICKGFADKAFGLVKTVSYAQTAQPTQPDQPGQPPQQ